MTLPLAGGPAFTGLRPSMPDRVASPPDVAARLRALIPEAVSIDRMETSARPPAGLYVVDRPNAPTLLVKVLPKALVPLQLAGDHLARFARDRGVRTGVIESGFPQTFDDDHDVLSYLYVRGIFARPLEKDLERVGDSVGRLHAVLSRYPAAFEIRDAALALQARLGNRREAILAGRELPASCPGLRETIEHSGALIDPLVARGQVTHGDLNYANVLLPPEGGAVILDFEEAPVTWLDPICDVATLLQRFARQEDPELSARLGLALLVSYTRAAGPAAARAQPFASVLGALAARSLLILTEKADPSIPPAEWSKFVDLHDEAKSRPAWLDRLSESYQGLQAQAANHPGDAR